MIIEGAVSLTTKASPASLWPTVRDVTRMGESSPETLQCERTSR
jgi:hypothetical protein